MEVKTLECSNKRGSQDTDCGPVKDVVEKAEEVSEEKSQEELEVSEELEEAVDADCECVNHIVIEPNINMTFDIES